MVGEEFTHRIGFCQAIDLARLAGPRLSQLPWSLRILLENVARRLSGADKRQSVEAILGWLANRSTKAEIAFHPARLLMHDTTCVPALVDIAGMRDSLAELGLDPSLLNVALPVDVSVDHSIAVDVFGTGGAVQINMQRELARNVERFRLMKWAEKVLKGFRVHPPGTGILHTINIEQLATVVTKDRVDGADWLLPDTLVGTDSHTSMVNGIGVLAWGIGGLEAEGIIFGLPLMMRVPDVIGVKLTGQMREGTMGTDLALVVAERLRRHGVSGQFVEFFGPGVSTLSAGDRALVANMAPEYGASTCYFPIDERTLAYLRATGRPEALVEQVETYARRQSLWFDPDAEPLYTDVLQIDLSAIEISIAGPTRPQDRLSPADAGRAIGPIVEKRRRATAASTVGPTDGSVAVAAITSCTNTSDPRLTIAAGLLARKARAFGLRPPEWVKTSLSPGSPAAARYLERAGLLDDLEVTGFGIVGFGCMTCIGNSGPLIAQVSDAIERDGIVPVAVLSGNRNFPGRVHPQIEAAFLASPALVIAYALAGDVNRNILTDPIGMSKDGRAITLADLWPSGGEIDAVLALAADPGDYRNAFASAQNNELWRKLDAPATPQFPWDEASTYIRRPPFSRAGGGSRLGAYDAAPLLVLGDDITTDHISPAGQVPRGSLAARYLIENGEDPADLNVFSARRGNYRAMVKGLFTNPNVVNELGDGIPAGSTVHFPSLDVLPLAEAADRYETERRSVVIVAGARYGAGSSRDWAAKGPALLGVRAVIAGSFERIHRQNLIGMGILPIKAPCSNTNLAGAKVTVRAPLEALKPRGLVELRIETADGETLVLAGQADVETELECALLRQGGIIPHILNLVRDRNDAPNGPRKFAS